jgi:hypothetical protein
MSATNLSSAGATFGQPYYPPTPPKDHLHDSLLDASNKQQQQMQLQQNSSSANPASVYSHSNPQHHNWGHVLKDSSLFWSSMKSTGDSPSKMSHSSLKKKPSQGEQLSSRFSLGSTVRF